jgi:ferrous iron transport protein A
MMPLTSVNRGQEVTLIDISGGRGIRSKLYSMGLIPGVRLTVLGPRGGLVMIAVHDTRLAIGVGMAKRIMVE